MCPRTESRLTYMIDIALTTEFMLGGGGGAAWRLLDRVLVFSACLLDRAESNG